MPKKRIIGIKVLPNQPLDGSGQVCIHLFVPDPDGSFVEPHVIQPVFEGGEQIKQKVAANSMRGRIACDAKLNPAPRVKDGVTSITVRTDDYRAVTCPKCIASKYYDEMKTKLETLLDLAPAQEGD